MTRPGSMLDHALRELADGGFVFPLAPKSKVPFSADHECPSGHQHQHGLNDAMSDSDIARVLWTAHPNANVGVNCERSGQVALDYDRRSDPSGTALEHLYAALGPLPQTRTVLTRSDGSRHWLFRANGALYKSGETLIPGIEIKHKGGYRVAVGSIHPETGKPYLFEEATAVLPLAECPDLSPILPVAEQPTPWRAPIAAKVGPGGRHNALTRIAGAMRRVGLTADEMLPTMLAVNANRFAPIAADDDVREVAIDIAQRYESADNLSRTTEIAAPVPTDGFVVVTIEEFSAREESGASALLGTAENAVIPEGGDFMVYGDGGAGKTTLMIDLACHFAAGDAWLGMPVQRALRVLLIENEGPRPHFRAKLRRKIGPWNGSPIGDRLTVLEHPWGALRLNDGRHREALAATIRNHEIDVVILGPVTRAGMDEAGTLQQVRDFMGHCADVRHRSDRPVCFGLVHHENKSGTVSGAWEASGDTLLHVQSQGPGRTRLLIQKCRWGSAYHQKTLHLAWTAGEGFDVIDAPERTDTAIADEILALARMNGGRSWSVVKKDVSGRSERVNEIRDRLLQSGDLMNTGTGQRMVLWHRDDPGRPPDPQTHSQRERVGDDEASRSGEAVVPRHPFPRSHLKGERVGGDRSPDQDGERP